ncbi:Uncharacterised protein [Staphylococcus aureus]|nr:Uncharacterised protein [Staphylococcus aureus]
MPNSFTLSPDINTTNPAPSVSGADVPAVTVPSALNNVLNLDKASKFVSALINSSSLNTSFVTCGPFGP